MAAQLAKRQEEEDWKIIMTDPTGSSGMKYGAAAKGPPPVVRTKSGAAVDAAGAPTGQQQQPRQEQQQPQQLPDVPEQIKEEAAGALGGLEKGATIQRRPSRSIGRGKSARGEQPVRGAGSREAPEADAATERRPSRNPSKGGPTGEAQAGRSPSGAAQRRPSGTPRQQQPVTGREPSQGGIPTAVDRRKTVSVARHESTLAVNKQFSRMVSQSVNQ
eukprot:GHVU01235421.1.p1 GENE.GHVU01235421.1~~GHVU01235421.1.p1  ORF type:complete len:217 (-),score=53.26 GHVU01235421.1:4-654(-)